MENANEMRKQMTVTWNSSKRKQFGKKKIKNQTCRAALMVTQAGITVMQLLLMWMKRFPPPCHECEGDNSYLLSILPTITIVVTSPVPRQLPICSSFEDCLSFLEWFSYTPETKLMQLLKYMFWYLLG